ncbi:Imm43 family immunity protein [Chromobacterium subtsugae]|uniref:Imm43 family immunity protein n=1 Tax=Chromobacterium subtsugae TaxID=251747 RepID=UPI000A468CBB|nr:DUF1629 domain-containing protein [Chromobacterium subtsugae]
MKKFYIMAMKEEPGCPSGFFYAYLLSEFNSNSYKSGYGKLPWYAGPKKFGGGLPPFPDNLSLIVENSTYEYDIRRGSPYFYVLSERVVNILASFKTSFSEIAPVSYLDNSGKLIPGKRYFVGKTKRISKKNIIDMNRSKVAGEFGEMFESIRFKSDLDLDLFDVFDVSPNQFSLIVSEELKNEMEKQEIKGINFLDVENVILNSQEDIETDDRKYAPI